MACQRGVFSTRPFTAFSSFSEACFCLFFVVYRTSMAQYFAASQWYGCVHQSAHRLVPNNGEIGQPLLNDCKQGEEVTPKGHMVLLSCMFAMKTWPPHTRPPPQICCGYNAMFFLYTFQNYVRSYRYRLKLFQNQLWGYKYRLGIMNSVINYRLQTCNS